MILISLKNEEKKIERKREKKKVKKARHKEKKWRDLWRAFHSPQSVRKEENFAKKNTEKSAQIKKSHSVRKHTLKKLMKQP